MATTERMTNLISYTVSEDHERPDLEACLEISDRINGTKPECMEALNAITKCLLKPNPKVVLNTVQLLETLCKNCNMRFLYELNNKKLVDALMKNLEDALKRAKSKSKSLKPIDKLKAKVEDKVLYLIQLWADTFMMHQIEFKNIHELYRLLRKEGVKFPDRDPNERFMISFQGQTSPVFLAMDENYIVPSNNQGGPLPDPTRQLSPRTQNKEPEYKHETFASKVVNTLYNEEDDYDYTSYDGVQITPDELKVLEESISILKEIEANAVLPGEMKSEIANEILADLVHVHKRIGRLLQSEKFLGTDQISEAIKINDMINTCLTTYKARYNLLKDNYSKGIKSEPVVLKAGGDTPKPTKNGEEGNKEESQKPEDDKKSGFLSSRKLAPPKGWAAPPKANEDLIDLMDADPTPNKEGNGAESKEEKKEDANPPKAKPSLIDNLLDLDFDLTIPVQPNNANPQANGAAPSNFPFGLLQQPQPTGFPGANFMGGMPMNQAPFNQFATNPLFPQPHFHGGFNTGVVNPGFAANPNMYGSPTLPQQQFMTAPPQMVNNPTIPIGNIPFVAPVQTQQVSSPLQQQKVQSPVNVQSPTQVQSPIQAQTKEEPKAEEQDDDFFSDIANRKK